MAAIASSRSRCSDCRSTLESVLSPPGWVWMHRTPASRVSDRRVLMLARLTVCASPTVTSSTSPPRDRYTEISRPSSPV